MFIKKNRQYILRLHFSTTIYSKQAVIRLIAMLMLNAANFKRTLNFELSYSGAAQKYTNKLGWVRFLSGFIFKFVIRLLVFALRSPKLVCDE